MKDIIKKVKKIEISTRRLVDGLLQGAYHSVFKGRGIEFSDVREYVYGDAIKTIDWNVTAKMDTPYVKEFVEERDLTAYIVYDASASGFFGYEKEKSETSKEIAASMVFAAQKNNDNVGLFIFTDKIEKYIPARKGRRHALKIISEMVRFTPKSKKTDLSLSIEKINKVVKKRSIFFIISDFDSPSFEKPFRILRKKHDVVPINIHDIRERDIPNVGFVELQDPESGETFMFDTSDRETVKKYVELVLEENKNIDEFFKKNRSEQINILSGEDFGIAIKGYFKRRAMLRWLHSINLYGYLDY